MRQRQRQQEQVSESSIVGRWGRADQTGGMRRRISIARAACTLCNRLTKSFTTRSHDSLTRGHGCMFGTSEIKSMRPIVTLSPATHFRTIACSTVLQDPIMSPTAFHDYEYGLVDSRYERHSLTKRLSVVCRNFVCYDCLKCTSFKDPRESCVTTTLGWPCGMLINMVLPSTR